MKQKVSKSLVAIIISVTMMCGFFSYFALPNYTAVSAAEDSRKLILEDELEDSSKVVSLTGLPNPATNLLTYDNSYIFPEAPSMSAEFVYDVSAMEFPYVQVEFNMCYYYFGAGDGDEDKVGEAALSAVSFLTSNDGTNYKKTSNKLLQQANGSADVTVYPNVWFEVKVVNFAAIPTGTKYIKIVMTSPKDIWDVQASRVAFYEASADDINLVGPTVKLKSSSYASKILKDEIVTILTAEATDDKTAAGDIIISVSVLSPVNSLVLIEDNKFLLSMYGTYKVIYSAYDSHGNLTEFICDIESTDYVGLETWAIVLIAVGAALVAIGAGFAVYWFLIRKKRKTQ